MKQTSTPGRRAARIDPRRQYDDLERQRSALAKRLKDLDLGARAHPGHKRALVLINDIFRKSALSQRREILNAADWLIGLLQELMAQRTAQKKAQERPPRDLKVHRVRRMLPPAANPARLRRPLAP